MKQIQESAKANEIAVSLGFSEKDNNSVYIAQVMIDPAGEIKFHRRKMKPTHMERTIFGDASGECFSSVAELAFARVGSLCCWEHIQPLLKYQTISQQEDIHVSAWPNVTPHTGGQDLWSMSAEGVLVSHPRGMFANPNNRLPESVTDICYRVSELCSSLHCCYKSKGRGPDGNSQWCAYVLSWRRQLCCIWSRWEKTHGPGGKYHRKNHLC